MPMCAQWHRRPSLRPLSWCYVLKANDPSVDRAFLRGVSNMNIKIFYRLALLGAAVCVVSTAGYAKNYPMTASNEVPGATAQLQVDKEKDGNIQLEVKANG